jgi:hypothetical protein
VPTKLPNGLDLNSAKITSVKNPTSAQDAATKAYADSLLSGYYDVTRDFGIVGDHRGVFDGACSTAANTKITSATIAFVAGDVGKRITLNGAGASSAMYVGTISAVDSSTQVTVSPTITTTVSGQGIQVSTDNTAGWTSLVSTINALAYPGVIVTFPRSVTNRFGLPIGLLFNKPVTLQGQGGHASTDFGDYSTAGGTCIAWNAPNNGISTWEGAIKFVPISGANAQPIIGVGIRDLWMDCYNGGQNAPLYGIQLYDCVGFDIRNLYIIDAIAAGIEQNILEPIGGTANTSRGMISNYKCRALENQAKPTVATLTPTTTTNALTLSNGATSTITLTAANGLSTTGYAWVMTEAGYPVLVNYTGGGGTTSLTGCTVSPQDSLGTPKTLVGSNIVQAVAANGACIKLDGSTTGNSNLSLLQMLHFSHGTTWGPSAVDIRNCDSTEWQLLVINGGNATNDGAVNRIRKPGVRLAGSETASLASRNNVFRDGDPGVGGVSSMALRGGGVKMVGPAGPNYWWDYQLANAAPQPIIELGSYFDWTANGGTTLGLRNMSDAAGSAYTVGTATVIPGSLVLMGLQTIQVGTTFRWRFQVAKTAAGTAARTTNIRIGTTGTVSDAVVQAFSMTGTAVADSGMIEVIYRVTAAGSASSTGVGTMTLSHGLQGTATGLNNTLGIPVVIGTPTVFTSPSGVPWYISLSMTTGTAEVITTSLCTAELIRVGSQAA